MPWINLCHICGNCFHSEHEYDTCPGCAERLTVTFIYADNWKTVGFDGPGYSGCIDREGVITFEPDQEFPHLHIEISVVDLTEIVWRAKRFRDGFPVFQN